MITVFKRRLARFAAVVAVAVPATVGASPTQASAAPATDTVQPLGTCTLVFCGRIKNSGSSDGDLWIIDNWPPENASGAFLRPGETSTKYFKDTDGVYIPTGCKGVRDWAPDWSGGAWYKFSNLFDETVRLDC
ncbi:hypothetical protein KIPE111705_14770 [Kibdelosporangium persicum]|uniref:Secreted protein n=1 Tax=Kibdelosporangium persicum TaxID=2698649 RepID=A0ABX2F7F3_9PSEU|nr:hypothetical protein [Kibdelosporangium persicum]NRN67285.1 hypothetical protein [Kibdelosporangium persicum]